MRCGGRLNPDKYIHNRQPGNHESRLPVMFLILRLVRLSSGALTPEEAPPVS